MSALQKAATETLGVLSVLQLATTPCSTLLNRPLLTSWRRSPMLMRRAPGTGGATSTQHPALGSSSSS
uniref:Uncharacterized protein n=1 Tax=Arundo donax TaxID=35708 RepID=A0A0A8YTI1_ARUDO